MSGDPHTLPMGGDAGGLGQPAPITSYSQQFTTPALSWTVPHSLGTTVPLVQVYRLDGSNIDDPDVDASDPNVVVVGFAKPFAGKIVVSKG